MFTIAFDPQDGSSDTNPSRNISNQQQGSAVARPILRERGEGCILLCGTVVPALQDGLSQSSLGHDPEKPGLLLG
jgi:hypothetical protein